MQYWTPTGSARFRNCGIGEQPAVHSPETRTAVSAAGPRRKGEWMPTELTKEKLYREAKRLGIKGRSKMTKSQLKSAIARQRRF